MGLEKRFAIIIGSNCYEEKKLQFTKLQFTIKDAIDVSNILQKRCEFEEENIICLKIEYPQNDIKKEILDAFENIKAKGFQKNMHTFLFYYSGHGLYDETERKSYLELSDTEKISIQDIFDKINELNGKNSYLIIDACHAGAQLDMNISKDKLTKQFHYNSKGIHCLLSTTSTLLSYEPNLPQTIKYDIKNSFLTHFFLEAINSPEKYTNGILGFPSIHDYTSIKSQIITVFKQIPVLQSKNTEGVHPFAIWKDADKIVLSKQSSPKPEIDNNYFKRNEEEILISKLEGGRVILLTGNSNCGKSAIAKAISLSFWEKGYYFKQTDDYAEASRFFNESNENRICLLEDPFGHHISNKNGDNLHKIQDLINNIPSNGKLIICSRSEVLKNINRSDSLVDWSIDGHEWYDLTVQNREFLVSIWKLYSVASKLPLKIQEQIEDFLLKADHEYLLQIGQLRHLSKVTISKLENQSTDSLCHLARADANELAKEVGQRGLEAWKLCVTLTLSSNTIIPVNLDDLIYILSDSKELFGFTESPKGFRTISWGNREEKTFSVPKYPTENWVLNDKFQQELDFLEERGYIRVNDNDIVFSHPHYKEMANYVLFELKLDRQKGYVVDYVLKTLAACTPHAAFLCAKQLSFIRENFKNKSLIINKIYENARESLTRSYYPSVRDQCATFLINNIAQLEDTQKEIIFNYIKRPIDDDDIIFKNGVPFIFENNTHSIINKIINKQDISNNNHPDILIKKIEAKEKIDVEDLWKALQSIENQVDHDKLTKIYSKAINANEIFIRTLAALNIMRNANLIQDWTIIEKVFADEHPAVVLEGIKGVLIGFDKYPSDLRKEVMLLSKQALTNELVVIRANTFMMNFATDYEGENKRFWAYSNENNKNTTWNVWSELLPIFLKYYPSHLNILNTGRYSSMLKESVNYLSEENCFRVAEATLLWINNKIRVKSLDTHEMSLIDFILNSLNKNKSIRFPIFKGIFDIKDTFFTLFNFSWCISSWSELTDSEKNVLLNILQEDRIDKQWIQAMACVQYEIPIEIQEILFSSPTFFSQKPKEIIEKIDKNLLLNCLIIYTGQQQFGDIGHKGGNIWLNIIKSILVTQYSFCFDICLNEMLNNAVNGFDEDWQKDGLEIWQYLCENVSSKRVLAETLIAHISICACNFYWSSKLWSILIKAYQEENKEDEIMKIIADNLEAFSVFNNKEDIFEFFDEEVLVKILRQLPSDLLVFDFIDLQKRKNINSGTDSTYIEKLVEICRIIPLKFWLTFYKIDKYISDGSIDGVIADKLKSIPNLIEDKGKEIQERSNQKIYGYKIENMVSYSKRVKIS